MTYSDGFNANATLSRECHLCGERVVRWTPALGQRPFDYLLGRGRPIAKRDLLWPAFCRSCLDRIVDAQDMLANAKYTALKGIGRHPSGATELAMAEILRQ